MSATVDSKPRTVQQRGVEATRRLRETLNVNDVKLLSVALAEASAEEVIRNPGFAGRVRTVYAELAAAKSARPQRPRRNRGDDVELVPLIQVEGLRGDPYAALDPYFLQRVYGDGQLRAALTGYSLAKLKEALPLVEQRNPGTKPKNRGRIDDVIDYIVEHVAGSK